MTVQPLRFLRPLALCASFAVAPATFAQPDPAATLPIADSHFHFMLYMKPEDLKARMDANHIRWAVSAGAVGAPGVGHPNTRDAAVRALLGDRYVPAVGNAESRMGEVAVGRAFYDDASNPRRDQELAAIEQLMAQQPRAFAEMYPNAETSSADPVRARRVATDGPFFQAVMEMAARHGRPPLFHLQYHPESVRQLEALMARHPDVDVVLAHCGKTTGAAPMRALLDKHPRLHCDLAYRGAPLTDQEARSDPARMVFWGPSLLSAGGIRPDWKQLIEDFPDRFMVAVDDVKSWKEYDEVVASIRHGVLRQLTPATAEKVAWRNAVRLYRLNPNP